MKQAWQMNKLKDGDLCWVWDPGLYAPHPALALIIDKKSHTILLDGRKYVGFTGALYETEAATEKAIKEYRQMAFINGRKLKNATRTTRQAT